MGLEEIVDRINKDTEDKANRIIDKARGDASKTLNAAAAKASSIRKMKAAKAENDSGLIVSKAASKAEVDGAQLYQKKVNDSINSSIDALRKHLSKYTKTDEYARLLSKLCSLAEHELGDGCKIEMQKDDAVKIRPGGKYTIVDAPAGFAGGIRAVSADGKRSVDYSLERLLESMNDRIAVELLKAMS
ncbi:hypothetical protein M1397_02420 [Candidatus Marsarchaeota archaeon]|jgi:vacuolar-type H+-ATPase subunit E/Vma4|nr:hypothetical protein [Candidatus Marsarchaeota archaeon]